MGKTSAGLLPYRLSAAGDLSVFIAHMGGPFWARRDLGGWSIVKGEYDAATEAPREVARREFAEEIGAPAPTGAWLDLGACRQPSGKVITAYAVAAGPELAFVASNEFELEWPRGSGRLRRFPEVDRAQWWPLPVARDKLVSGQAPILDRLAQRLGPSPSRPR
jgi:predicted NUDIX family NTP pyrophosphohydrolase